ncbi:hypothetical protein WICPIJ_009604 [Wickerhamomyces pijperi]|uniref:Uncharacterized protein n=1 Tax=Wickerhamomyces pijperi TaxID=599730 RepID=A0A9P8PL42_WICPI|nr:hypothetical protein WICPIJ_009604 [Wickerhamomyces pijperi]
MNYQLISLSLLLLALITQAIPIPISQTSKLNVQPSIFKPYHLFHKHSSFTTLDNQIVLTVDSTTLSSDTPKRFANYKDDAEGNSNEDMTFFYDIQKGIISVNGDKSVVSLNSTTQSFQIQAKEDEQVTPSIFQISQDGKLELSYNSFINERQFKLCPVTSSALSANDKFKDLMVYGLYSKEAECGNDSVFTELNLIDQVYNLPLRSLQPDYLEVYDGCHGKLIYL